MKEKKFSIIINIVMGVAFVASSCGMIYYRSAYLKEKASSPKIVVKNEISTKYTEKDSEIVKLKKQVSDLEDELKSETVNLTKNPPQPIIKSTQKKRSTLQDMKVENPERYQKMIDYYTRMSERVANGLLDKIEFFNELDTSSMSNKELLNHNELMDKLKDLHEKVDGANLADNPDSIREAMRTQWKNYREVNGLMKKERDFMIIDGARRMGLDDEEAKLLKDYVKNSYELTSGRSMFRGRGKR